MNGHEPYVPAVATDLYRDMAAIQAGLFRLSVLHYGESDAVILAPFRDGRLRDSTFLGHRVVEADVPSCLVAWLL